MKKPSNPKTGKKEHNHYRWALTAFVMAVALSGLLSLSSEAILENAGLLLALLVTRPTANNAPGPTPWQLQGKWLPQEQK